MPRDGRTESCHELRSLLLLGLPDPEYEVAERVPALSTAAGSQGHLRRVYPDGGGRCSGQGFWRPWDLFLESMITTYELDFNDLHIYRMSCNLALCSLLAWKQILSFLTCHHGHMVMRLPTSKVYITLSFPTGASCCARGRNNEQGASRIKGCHFQHMEPSP